MDASTRPALSKSTSPGALEPLERGEAPREERQTEAERGVGFERLEPACRLHSEQHRSLERRRFLREEELRLGRQLARCRHVAFTTCDVGLKERVDTERQDEDDRRRPGDAQPSLLTDVVAIEIVARALKQRGGDIEHREAELGVGCLPVRNRIYSNQ